MVAPVMTFNAAGNVRASGALAGGATATADVDYSAKVEGQVTLAVTLGGTVATTHGVRIDAFAGYGTGPSYTATPAATATVAQTTAASGSDSITLYLPTGKYRISITNLDATNSVTASVTSATVDSYA